MTDKYKPEMLLRKYRKDSNTPIKLVSDYMGVTPRTVRNWETGEAPITAHTLLRLLRLYRRTDGLYITDIERLVPRIKYVKS